MPHSPALWRVSRYWREKGWKSQKSVLTDWKRKWLRNGDKAEGRGKLPKTKKIKNLKFVSPEKLAISVLKHEQILFFQRGPSEDNSSRKLKLWELPSYKMVKSLSQGWAVLTQRVTQNGPAFVGCFLDSLPWSFMWSPSEMGVMDGSFLKVLWLFY